MSVYHTTSIYERCELFFLFTLAQIWQECPTFGTVPEGLCNKFPDTNSSARGLLLDSAWHAEVNLRECVFETNVNYSSALFSGFRIRFCSERTCPTQSFGTTPLLHAVLSPVEGCFTSGRLSARASSGADTCNTVSRLAAMNWDDCQFFIGMFFVGLSL